MSAASISGPEAAGLALMALGAVFFVAGTVGMLRFPCAVSRLHALTKADTMGLGLVVLGAAVMAGTGGAALRLALIWVAVALAGALGAQLIAAFVRREGRQGQNQQGPDQQGPDRQGQNRQETDRQETGPRGDGPRDAHRPDMQAREAGK